MKKLLCLSALVCAASVFANDLKKEEMMQAWMKYSTPGEQHKTLANMAGKWKFTTTFWESAESKPETSMGTSTMKMILGGRFLQHDYKGKAMGQPMQGMGITGYDNVKEKYDTIWLDSMGTGIMHGTGNFDQASNTLSDSGSFSCPMTKSKSRNYRSDWKIMDRNNMTYTMWGPGIDDPKEFKQMEIVFKRIR